MRSSLFDFEQNLFFDQSQQPEAIQVEGNPALAQWFTPEWAASLLVERYFPHLSSSDLVIEPACGPGSFIKAIPEDVPVIGVEIDPELAEVARQNTGRRIITGDFTKVPLPENVTAVIGNPPYVLSLFESFLARAHSILPNEGRLGMLVPAYFWQTHSNVNAWSEKWSMRVDMIPRSLFPGIKLPLAFGVFQKDRRRQMIGLALYAECGMIRNLAKPAQEVLANGRPRTSVWRALVHDTLEQLGGSATLDQIYHVIEPKRPTATAFWREKVRQQLQRFFVHRGPGEWALAAA